eukprot:c18570_g1_i1 orf=191-745(-)
MRRRYKALLLERRRAFFCSESKQKMTMDFKGCAWMVMVVLGLSLLMSSADANSSWKPCSSTEDYRVSVTDVKVNPDPVIRGSDALFEIPAVAKETIEGGRVTIQVYYLGVPVHTEENDLCTRTSCPIAPGEFSISSAEGLPSFTPTGSYRLDMRIQNTDGDLLTCLKINFRIAAPDSLNLWSQH